MVVVLTLEKRTNQLLAGPDIVSRGFVYVRESEDLMGEAREVVEEALDGCLSKNISDWGKIKSTIKDALGDYVWKKTKRRPMILPIIMRHKYHGQSNRMPGRAHRRNEGEQGHIRITCGWKRNLKKDPDLKSRVDDYRIRNYRLQQSENVGPLRCGRFPRTGFLRTPQKRESKTPILKRNSRSVRWYRRCRTAFQRQSASEYRKSKTENQKESAHVRKEKDAGYRAALTGAKGTVRLLIYVCVILVIILAAKTSYQFGHDVFAEEPVASREKERKSPYRWFPAWRRKNLANS